jgi:hypothetical protein
MVSACVGPTASDWLGVAASARLCAGEAAPLSDSACVGLVPTDEAVGDAFVVDAAFALVGFDDAADDESDDAADGEDTDGEDTDELVPPTESDIGPSSSVRRRKGHLSSIRNPRMRTVQSGASAVRSGRNRGPGINRPVCRLDSEESRDRQGAGGWSLVSSTKRSCSKAT